MSYDESHKEQVDKKYDTINMNVIVHIKLDRETLPKDGQQVSFQTQDEEWHDGYFVEGDDLFWINENKWYSAFDVVSWKP